MSGLRFSKGHGLGNDYLVIERSALPWPLSDARVRWLCDRHRGIGSDGILVVDTGQRPFELRIRNPDGSEAEKSGNGLRILAAWLHSRGLVRTGETFEVALVKDTVRMSVEAEADNGVLDVIVDIGRASFRAEDVGFTEATGEVLDYALGLSASSAARINTVSLGNPHCVVFVDTLNRDDFLLRAPRLCTHPAFAHGINVQFARIAAPHRIEAWIWERGAGETLASGSSACAVACAAVRRGLVGPVTLEVVMIGGTASVSVSPSFDVRLRGPAQIVLHGEVAHGGMETLRDG